MRLKIIAVSAIGLMVGIVIALKVLPGTVDNLLQRPKNWTIGKAAIGGPFEMVDHSGRNVTEKTFQGRYLLVFFGFTYCPDVCPATLQNVTAVLGQLGTKAQKLRPLFVSVDPQRDTPEVLHEYMSNFDSRITGLTGSTKQVAKITKAYRAYSRKVQNSADPDDYTMDHSAFLYLMAPDGEFITHFTHITPLEKIVERIKREIS